MRDDVHLASVVAQETQRFDNRHRWRQTMILITELQKIYKISEPRALVWQPHLVDAMARYQISTPLRAAHFLTQVGHESGRLRFLKELWNPAQVPAQKTYEGAARLGNTEAGDGERYMGRGLIQITGRKNYQAVSDALGIDFITQPRLLERTDYAALSAAWFWQFGAGKNLGRRALLALTEFNMGVGVDLNDLADLDKIEAITLCVNGGLNGFVDRQRLLLVAKSILMKEKQ